MSLTLSELKQAVIIILYESDSNRISTHFHSNRSAEPAIKSQSGTGTMIRYGRTSFHASSIPKTLLLLVSQGLNTSPFALGGVRVYFVVS